MNDFNYYEWEDSPSYYGGFRTRTFSQIFTNVSEFTNYCKESGVLDGMFLTEDDTLNKLYYLLYSKYGNSHIKSSDETQFKYKMISIIFQYGPTWEKRLQTQSEIRKLNIDDVRVSSKLIQNHSQNPSTAPTTNTLEELPTINDQIVNSSVKGIGESYVMLDGLLINDITEGFLNKFMKLFRTVVSPDTPLLYISEE